MQRVPMKKTWHCAVNAQFQHLLTLELPRITSEWRRKQDGPVSRPILLQHAFTG
jgi:hypothetical protein